MVNMMRKTHDKTMPGNGLGSFPHEPDNCDQAPHYRIVGTRPVKIGTHTYRASVVESQYEYQLRAAREAEEFAEARKG